MDYAQLMGELWDSTPADWMWGGSRERRGTESTSSGWTRRTDP